MTRLLVAHFQRARSRASAVVLTRRAASTQWLSVGTRAPKHRTYFCRAQRSIHRRSRTCPYSNREMGIRTKHFRDNCKTRHLRSQPFPTHVLHVYHCSTGYMSVWLMTTATLRTQMNLVTSLPSLPRCNNRGVLVCVVLRCKLACAVPPTLLKPRLASRTFGVSKDESRCKFLGDRRPMNSRERSTGRAHLPHCSRLRRLILRTSETIQITMRATNCFHLYEVLARVCRDKGSESWLAILKDESLDVLGG